MTLEEFKTKYPDIASALVKEGDEAGYARGLKDGEAKGTEKANQENQAQAKIDGAAAERERIKSVQDQLISGHEDLIQELMFDGKTSGPEAAVKVLAAEKKLRQDTLTTHRTESPEALPDPSTDNAKETTTEDKNLPVDERAKVEWDKDPKVRAEFDGDFDGFLAFKKAEDRGAVKILKRKD